MITILNNWALGAIPSPDDPRDYEVSRFVPLAPPFPDTYLLSIPEDVKNQGMVGSCVAHALATGREINEMQQHHIVKLSPGFIYANRRDHTWLGEGMIPREALQSLKSVGVVPLTNFSYNQSYPAITKKLEPINKLDSYAKPYKITGYARLYTNDDVKTALMNIGPVPVSYTVYDPWYRVTSTGILSEPQQDGKQHGGHMVLIVGWTIINKKEYWVIVNSWGRGWGDAGKGYIPTTGYEFKEAWSMTDHIFPTSNRLASRIEFSIAPDRAGFVSINDVSFTLPAPIVMKDDRIFVPLRFVSECFSCAVNWESLTGEITITSSNASKIIKLYANTPQYTINGKSFEMDTTPFVVDPGYTMVPVRFVSDALGYTVLWDDTTRKATILK